NVGGDILLSIHFNGGDPSVTGVESFYGELNYGAYGGDPVNDIAFCEFIVPEVKNILGSSLRGTDGIKPDTETAVGSLGILRYSDMPACLIEMEFISAQKEIMFKNVYFKDYKSLFLSELYQDEAAISLKKAILDYYGLTEEGLPTNDVGGGDLGDPLGDNTYYIAEDIDPLMCSENNRFNSIFKGFVYPVNATYGKRVVRTNWAGSYRDSTCTIPYAGRHPGVDLDDRELAGMYYSTIHAITDGEVISVKQGCIKGDYGCNGGWGNYVIIRHNHVPSPYDPFEPVNITSAYAHLYSIDVSEGQIVKPGDVIGIMGTTGASSGEHLHFQIDRDVDLEINPYKFTWLPSWVDNISPFTWYNSKTKEWVYSQWNIPENISVYLDLSGPGKPLYHSANYNHENHPTDEYGEYLPQKLHELTIDPLPYMHKYPYGKVAWQYLFGGERGIRYFLNHPDGTIVKEAGDETKYYIDGGKLREIPMWQYIEENALNVTATITPMEMKSYQKSNQPLTYPDGTLFHFNDRYYIVSEQKKLEFVKCVYCFKMPYRELGYEFEQFIPISQEAFDSFEYSGQIGNWDEHPVGSYVYNTNDGIYYLIGKDNGQTIMNPIYTDDIRASRGLRDLSEKTDWVKSSIALAEDSISYEKGDSVGLRSGTLVKPRTERDVYLVYGDTLRKIKDQSDFWAMGYSFNDVLEIPDAVFTHLPHFRGPDISIQSEILRFMMTDPTEDKVYIVFPDVDDIESVNIYIMDENYDPVGIPFYDENLDACVDISLDISSSAAKYVYIGATDVGGQLHEYIDPLDYAGSDEKFEQEVNNTALRLEMNLTEVFAPGQDHHIDVNYTEDNQTNTTNITNETTGYQYVNVSFGLSHFEGFIDPVDIGSDCIADSNFSVTGSSQFSLCPGTYPGQLIINSSNVEIDLNGAELTGGIVAYSGYNMSEMQAMMEGIDPLKLTRQEINDMIDTIPRFENITVKNGVFSGKGLNISAVKNAVIIDNEFTDSGIFLGAVNAEVRGNIFNGSDSNALLFGGGDSLIADNSISGTFGQGIAAVGFNITVDSNNISGSSKGIGSIGMWHRLINNKITGAKEGISGLFFVESSISGNIITSDYGIKGSCIGSNDLIGNIFETSEGIKLGKFFNNKCSKQNNFTDNCFAGSQKVDVMGKIITDGEEAYGNIMTGSSLANASDQCFYQTEEDILSNSLFWQHDYNIVYNLTDPKPASRVSFMSNFVSDWDVVDMQELEGLYYIGFDSLAAGERIFNIEYDVGRAMNYYAVSSQGLAGDVYLNGQKLDCNNAYYSAPYSANFKVVLDGEADFTSSGTEGLLPVCSQLCSEEKLSRRTEWLSGGELSVPSAVFTGQCYYIPPGGDFTLGFGCPAHDRNLNISGAYSWNAGDMLMMDSDLNGISNSFQQSYESAPLSDQDNGFSVYFTENSTDYWMDYNPCHPDVVLVIDADGKWVHHIMPPSD
ncbi:peptidoglycan DD-metalloendopeptidase family protein, partial [Candidatus Woesearchaeota archaeon]|nr:peptidoglycan DD-metalloendopeptidase family protein [Candidatus Woesearchaeota archaeon]